HLTSIGGHCQQRPEDSAKLLPQLRGGVAERSKAAVLKTARAQVLVGSNPTPSSSMCPAGRNGGSHKIRLVGRARSCYRSSTMPGRYFQSFLIGTLILVAIPALAAADGPRLTRFPSGLVH